MAPIDVELCLGGRDISEPRLAPDGSRVAFVASSDGVARIVVRSVDGAGAEERPLSTTVAPRAGRGMGGGCFGWHPSGRSIVFTGADGAIWQHDVDGPVGAPSGVVTRGPDGAALSSPVVSPGGGMLACVDEMRAVLVAPLDGATGTPGPATSGRATSRSVAPGRGAPGAAAGDPAGTVAVGDAVRVDPGDDFCLDPVWSPDGSRLAWQAWNVPAMPWDHSEIVEHSVATGRQRRMGVPGAQAQQPRYRAGDAGGALHHLGDAGGWLCVCREGELLVPDAAEHGGPTWGPGQRSFAVGPGGAVALCRNEGGFGRLRVLDAASGEVRDVARAVHGSLDWVGGTLVGLRSGARTPTQLVAYDTATWERSVLAVGPHPGWAAVGLVEPELLEVAARDAAPLHARLYRAPGGSDRLLCWVHGGPTDQWQVTFMPRIAYWVSRGWNVVVPDHRGSTGHGRAYQQAIAGRWGELDISDTADVLAAVQREGLGRPSTTVAIGASAGGFTVLGLLAHHGAMLAAGVAAYPVCDLVDLAATSHRFEAHYNDTLVGPAATHLDVWRRRSPLTFAGRIAVPLLVLHGSDDPVVGVDQSEALVAAIRARGGDAELTVYPGEGHGFRRVENQRDEYARIGRFLQRVVAAES